MKGRGGAEHRLSDAEDRMWDRLSVTLETFPIEHIRGCWMCLSMTHTHGADPKGLALMY